VDTQRAGKCLFSECLVSSNHVCIYLPVCLPHKFNKTDSVKDKKTSIDTFELSDRIPQTLVHSPSRLATRLFFGEFTDTSIFTDCVDSDCL